MLFTALSIVFHTLATVLGLLLRTARTLIKTVDWVVRSDSGRTVAKTLSFVGAGVLIGVVFANPIIGFAAFVLLTFVDMLVSSDVDPAAGTTGIRRGLKLGTRFAVGGALGAVTGYAIGGMAVAVLGASAVGTFAALFGETVISILFGRVVS